MTTQTQTDTAGLAPREATERVPLARPHHSIAAVLLVLSMAAFLYFAGMIGEVEGGRIWVGFVTAILASLAAQTYLIRAHTGRFGLGNAKLSTARAIPAGGAFGILIAGVMPAYYVGVDERMFAYVMGCLALAVLISMPMQLLLEANDRKVRQLKELGGNPR